MIMAAAEGREASAVWFGNDGLTPAQLEGKRQNIIL